MLPVADADADYVLYRELPRTAKATKPALRDLYRNVVCLSVGVGLFFSCSRLATLRFGPAPTLTTSLWSGSSSSTTAAEPAVCANGFPSDFIWGLGTAAYQIEGGWNEGGRSPSIWDEFSQKHPEKIYNGDTGDVADDHFHRFRSDVALMASIGLRYYRWSISWSRVMAWDAQQGKMVPNEEGLLFYDALLDALEAAGIQSMVTLYHWGAHTPILRDTFASHAATP